MAFEKQANEGIESVEVCLYSDADADGVLDVTDPQLACQNTNATGNYNFSGYLPGAYLVEENTATQPAGAIDTTANLLSVSLVVVNPGDTSTGHDFGDIVYSSIQGVTYYDIDRMGSVIPVTWCWTVL